jgi:serine/threonine-protein kinase
MSEPDSGQASRLRGEDPDAGADVDVPEHDSPSTDELQRMADENAALMRELTIGTTIDAKYRVDAIIGKGAMGVVLAATHIHLKERVALKFLSMRAHAHGKDFHSRFQREAQVSAKLRNEHITRVIDVGTWREKIPFMVMDLLEGDDLRRTLKQAPEGRLPAPIALDYIVQVCEGLAEAHSHGIVHRDLKPSNLFVTRKHDGSDLIKILDFGISKWSAQEEHIEELTQTGVVLGSPKYMAPEQLFGSSTVDSRADVWSIGAIFYEMLAGRPPYDYPTLTRICAELAADRPPPSLKAIVPGLPDGLEAVVFRCFARDREHRIANVAELAGDLLDAVDAPFADEFRQKIAASLDPRGMGASLSTSSGSMPKGAGNYGRLSVSGSSRPGAVSSAAIRAAAEGVPPSLATAGGVEALAGTPRKEQKRKGAIAILIAIALLLGATRLFFAFSATHGPDASKGGATAAATIPSPPVPPAPAAVTATAAVNSATSSAGMLEPAPAPLAATAPSAAAASPPAKVSRPGGGGATGGGRHGSSAKTTAPTPPAPSATAEAPVAPAPAPTPAPPKANPLEDRQ